MLDLAPDMFFFYFCPVIQSIQQNINQKKFEISSDYFWNEIGAWSHAIINFWIQEKWIWNQGETLTKRKVNLTIDWEWAEAELIH